MMKKAGWAVAAALGTSGLAQAQGPREVLYLDADDGGRHARISAELEGAPGHERLIVRIRPWGQGVEREGGWRTRDGFNAHTAREMASVLRAEGFEARLQGGNGLRGAAVEWNKSFTTFPRRALREDRTIDYLARTEELVSELTLNATEGLQGTGALELLARGEPRLRVEYDLKAGRILRFAMPGHSQTVSLDVLIAEQEVVEPLPLPENWGKRSLDEKWRWYRAEVKEDVELRGRLVAALEKGKDWMFLEQVALYVAGSYDTHSIGLILQKNKTANWRRLSAWFSSVSTGHGALHTKSLLNAKGHKAVSLGWVNAHLERADHVLTGLKKTWEGEGVKPVATEGELPPFTEDEVFGGIGEAFQPREKDLLEEGKMQTVVRGIDGWEVSQRWGSPFAAKVVELIGDRDWRVAQAACLSFAHGRTAVPSDALWQVAHHEEKPAALREAAFLAWSYGNWGEAFKALHEYGGQPTHVLWKPAVSRLGEFGNNWTLQMLTAQQKKRGGPILGGSAHKLLSQEIAELKEKAKAGRISHDFESTVWAIVLGYSRSADMEDWLLDFYGTPEFDKPKTRQTLRKARGWTGNELAPKVQKERLAVRERLQQELEFRWEKARKEP